MSDKNSENVGTEHSGGDAVESPHSAPETRTFTEMHFRFGPCFHSMLVADCVGCLRGHAARMEAQLHKLEHSTALPIRERIEKAVREHMQHCYQVYKGVPPTVEDWVGGALHYVMWGIERDLPLIDAAVSGEPEQEMESDQAGT